MNEIAARYSDDPDVQKLIAELLHSEDNVPPGLWEELRGGNEAVEEALVEVLEDEELAFVGAPGDGWAPVHAATLLGERRSKRAIEPLVELVRDGEFETTLYSTAVSSLQQIGPPALEPLLENLDESDDPDVRCGIAGVVADLGIRDDRIMKVLEGVLDEEPVLGAYLMNRYGDPEALETLRERLDETPIPEDDDPDGREYLVELAAAVEGLGGDLTEEQHDKLERAEVLDELSQRLFLDALLSDANQFFFEAERRQQPFRKPERELGRNEPCWCGSGKKYKHCHRREELR